MEGPVTLAPPRPRGNGRNLRVPEPGNEARVLDKRDQRARVDGELRRRRARQSSIRPVNRRSDYFVKLNSAVLAPTLPSLNAIFRRRHVLAQLLSVFHT